MARPVRCRRICVEPKYDSFIPCGVESTEQVLLTVDEEERKAKNFALSSVLHRLFVPGGTPGMTGSVKGEKARLKLPGKGRKTG